MSKYLRAFSVFVIAVFILNNSLLSAPSRYVQVKAKAGDAISKLLVKYKLPADDFYSEKFVELNENNLDKNNGLIKGKIYNLPIKILKMSPKGVATTLKTKNKEKVITVEDYNKLLEKIGLKPKGKGLKTELWIPLKQVQVQSEPVVTEIIAPKKKSYKKEILTDNSDEKSNEGLIDNENISEHKSSKKQKKSKIGKENLPKNGIYPIFGKELEKVIPISSALKGNIYYLISGHGGPDPGAIGNRSGHDLWEHEYAYDVILRLGRKIIENGGQVYFIVQDAEDGIRDGQYLIGNGSEKLLNGDSISEVQKIRLRQRTNLINNLVQKNKARAKSQQAVEIHLDSRITNERIDIFFYFKQGNDRGESLANTLQKVVKIKYDKNQPGRGYHGTVTTRNLFMLRETSLPFVFIELGNIKNPNDQYRFVDKNNRQAIGNWLCDGLIEAAKTQKSKLKKDLVKLKKITKKSNNQ
ncbi:MAG: N-acetylmuramoyl-L-alanine amidase [Candidatus Kapabacteria bacterium]|nr:N-acetylmuramoyl-L-alanine amidase [Candidatus Kapabacteria bacterium]